VHLEYKSVTRVGLSNYYPILGHFVYIIQVNPTLIFYLLFPQQPCSTTAIFPIAPQHRNYVNFMQLNNSF